MDGAVYEWDAFTGKRVGESVLKSCSYSSVAITPDGKTTFAVGSDKSLKEVADSQVCGGTLIPMHQPSNLVQNNLSAPRMFIVNRATMVAAL